MANSMIYQTIPDPIMCATWRHLPQYHHLAKLPCESVSHGWKSKIEFSIGICYIQALSTADWPTLLITLP